MSRTRNHLGTTLSAMRVLSGTGHSAFGAGISRHRNMDGAMARFSGAFGVWQTMPRLGCATKLNAEPVQATEATERKKLAPMATILQTDVAAIKPHTGPAAGKEDPGG